MAEFFLLIAVLILPVVVGVLAALAHWHGWWAAAGSVMLAMIAAIAPAPEAGESRVAAEDVVFLLLVAVWVAGLAWLSFAVTRRMWVRRRDSPAS